MYVYERSSEQLWMPCCWTRRKSNEAEASFFSGFRFFIFLFSWTFLSFGREWASDSMTSRFLISRFSLIKDNYFYHLCQNSNRAPMMIISRDSTTTRVHPPLWFGAAWQLLFTLHMKTWNPNNSPLIFYFFRDQDS